MTATTDTTPHKYRIEATILKLGGAPVSRVRFQNTPMTEPECVRLFSKRKKEAGKSFSVKVNVTAFSCSRVQPE
ncbi:DUF1187 family protein [Escherichia coli]